MLNFNNEEQALAYQDIELLNQFTLKIANDKQKYSEKNNRLLHNSSKRHPTAAVMHKSSRPPNYVSRQSNDISGGGNDTIQC